MISRTLLAALSLTIAVASGCSSSATAAAPLVVDDGCQPLLATTSRETSTASGCLVPYPSDAYRTADATTATGFRIALHGAAQPRTIKGAVADPHEVYASDGYSTASTLVATLPGPIVRDGLPGVFDDPSVSASAESGSVILRADTGELVAHYVDVRDNVAEGAPRPIELRAIAPLVPRTRYVVALSGVKLEGGAKAAAAEGFRRLRDHEHDPAVDGLAARFESDVFAPLAKAGVKRESLQLAWDFTTGSAEQPTRDMLSVREQTLAWLTTNVPDVKVSAVEAKDGTIVRGTVSGPMFLDAASHLTRGADGVPVQNGTTTFDFTAVIPDVVKNGTAPGLALAYGHGFFGDRSEVEGDAALTIGKTLSAVTFGIDWWGMARPDLAGVTDKAASDIPHVPEFAERVHQAMVNWLVMTAAIRGPMAGLAEMKRPSGDTLYAPSFVAYFGASMAHILGSTMVALNPDLSRAVFDVGGGGWTHIMPRSGNFGAFAFLVGSSFDDPVVVQAVLAMLARPLDRIDPVSYAPYLIKTPLAGSPPDRRFAIQIGLGDAGVPNVASFLLARALGVKQTVPSPKPIAGLDTTPGGEPGSALTLFDFGVDTSGYAQPYPLPANQVHDGLRTTKSALVQMAALLKPDGVVIHPCDGPCDPE
jgi:hypothetical protein